MSNRKNRLAFEVIYLKFNLMGNCLQSKNTKSNDNARKIESLQNSQNSEFLNENNNLIINEEIHKTNKNNTNCGEKIKNKINLDLYQILHEISSDIKAIKENESKFENVERNNHCFNSVPIYNGDFVLEQMKNEWLEKEKKKFKNQIKSEIKGNLILPEIKNLKSEIEKINEINSTNNIKIGEQFKNEINNLKKYFDIEKEKIEKENNTKIENLTKQNENEIKSLKNEYKNKFEKLNNIFELKLSNLIEQNNINKKNFENYKNETQIEIVSLKEQIKNEKKEKENLKKQINEKFKKEIDILKNQIKELSEQIKIINNTLKQKTKKIIAESFENFGCTFTKLYQINKYKKQQELKKKLFLGKNFAKVGLNNIGNNCYINSVLQILKNIPKFTYNFFKLQNNTDTFLCSLKDLLINLCKSNISSFPPNEFKKYLGLECEKFTGNKQYDSTIFYISLLNIIAKKLNKPNNIKLRNFDMDKYKTKSKKDQFDIYKAHYLLKHSSFIHEFFYIFYSNTTNCESCQYSKELFQATNYLDFPIFSEKGPVKSLEECFKNFQEDKEIIDECSECDCKKLSQNFTIYELPPVLMINLKRVGENSSYFNEIDIPFQLDMSKIIEKNKINSIYELRGFIKHDGDENSGHNYSYCKNMFDGKWYEYSDAICTPIDGEPKLDKIFFLCYIEIGNDIDNVEYLKQII